jgi:O-acetyl-ADP-ribose deacetylase (regulator of RNase III)
MNNVRVLVGDLFASQAQTLTNTVNTVGVMGKGIALEFKKRFPDMHEDYVRRCEQGRVQLGQPYLFKALFPPWVLNFPTKEHWRSLSRLDAITDGLEYLAQHYRPWGIESAACQPIPAQSTTQGALPAHSTVQALDPAQSTVQALDPEVLVVAVLHQHRQRRDDPHRPDQQAPVRVELPRHAERVLEDALSWMTSKTAMDALATARRQDAMSQKLRAAASLARTWSEQGKPC